MIPAAHHIAARRRKLCHGFTLIEVLVAVVIVGVVLPIAMRGISLATTVANLTHQRATAATLARQKLDELVTTKDYKSSALEGDYGDDAPEFAWHVTLDDWSDSTLSLLTVRVTWTWRYAEQSVSMSTLVPQETL